MYRYARRSPYMPHTTPDPFGNPGVGQDSNSSGSRVIMRERRRRFVFSAIFLNLCLICFILETGTRILTRTGWTPFGDWVKADGIRFKLDGGSDGLNSLGFRDRERTGGGEGSTWRVILLGDSFVWGVVDYAKNFPCILEKNLNRLGPDREIELINLGVPGYGPVESLEMWKSIGVGYDPDFVVYGFFYGNDVTDNLPGKQYHAVLGERVLIKHDYPWNRSRFLALLCKRIKLFQFRMTHDVENQMEGIAEKDLIEPRKYFMGLLHEKKIGHYEHYYSYLETQIREFKRFAEETARPLLVLRFPEKVMVDRATCERVASEAGYDMEDIAVTRICRKLDSILVDAGISSRENVVAGDMTPMIAGHQDREELYIETHWNERGNGLAADAMLQPVYRFLAEQGVRFRRQPGSPSSHGGQVDAIDSF